MAKYKKCPRCELNYIPQDEEMCEVCKAELGLETTLVLLDDIIDEDEPLKLCPVCKAAYISQDEQMCENCLARDKEAEEIDDEDSDEWRTYLDDDDTKPSDEEDIISLDELEADEDFGDDEDEFEDEENLDLDLDDYPDDFDEEFDDDFDDLDDDEDDDDEDDIK